MKKPLMLIPPAQAEALYDAALHDTRPGRLCASAMPVKHSLGWGVWEWEEDDALSLTEEPGVQRGWAASSAHD